MLDWSDLELLNAIAAEASLAGAARRLGVDQTTASRRLARLERQLGTKVFDRIDGRLELTSALARAQAAIATMAEAAQTARASLMHSKAELSGRVSISSLGFYLARVLAPRLVALHRRHPEVSLDLIAEDRAASFERREADIAVRFFATEESVALTTAIGRVVFRRYRARNATAAQAPVASYEDGLCHVPEMQLLQRLRPRYAPTLRSNRLDVLIEAAASIGAEIMLPESMGDTDARFERCDSDEVRAERPVYLLIHPDRRRAPAVDAVVRWLKDMREA